MQAVNSKRMVALTPNSIQVDLRLRMKEMKIFAVKAFYRNIILITELEAL